MTNSNNAQHAVPLFEIVSPSSSECQSDLLPSNHADRFKDELNFAEFPLASLADRVPEGQKKLEFHDTIFDQSVGQHITRKLTIAASDMYGLPTALDEEVILGLIQLTDKQRFASRTVYFSSYELIKLLGWNDSAKSYRRIDESLKRWVSITLFYDKAWWSKEEQCWVNESFHLLDSVTVYDKERRANKKSLNPGDENAGRSYFVWNDIVFRSFKAGNLKEIDLDIYKQLRSAISKRMYRFLDKHFYRRAHLEYDLLRFAYEHVGISRTTPVAEVKRLLAKPLVELEGIGFIKPIAKEERFIKVSKGNWKVAFDRGNSEAKLLLSAEQSVACEQLKERGVSPAKASKLVRSHDANRIASKIAIFDWMMQRGDKRCSSNPAGFLVMAIQEDYAAPSGFLKSKEEAKAEFKVVSTKLIARPNRKQEQNLPVEPEKPSESEQQFDSFWATLNEDERASFEQEAFDGALPFNQRFYLEKKERGGVLFATIQRRMLIDHFEASAK